MVILVISLLDHKPKTIDIPSLRYCILQKLSMFRTSHGLPSMTFQGMFVKVVDSFLYIVSNQIYKHSNSENNHDFELLSLELWQVTRSSLKHLFERLVFK